MTRSVASGVMASICGGKRPRKVRWEVRRMLEVVAPVHVTSISDSDNSSATWWG